MDGVNKGLLLVVLGTVDGMGAITRRKRTLLITDLMDIQHPISVFSSRYLVEMGVSGSLAMGLGFSCLFVVVPEILAFVGVVVALGSLRALRCSPLSCPELLFFFSFP
jgi:hypothetical protein